MLTCSINYLKFKPEKLVIYSSEPKKSTINKYEYLYEIPIMYKYVDFDQPLNLEGPEMYTSTGISFPSSGAVIDTYVGGTDSKFLNKTFGVIDQIYRVCVEEIWNTHLHMHNIKTLPSIECIYSLTKFPFYTRVNRYTGDSYPNSVHRQQLEIHKETIFRLPITENDDYIEIPRHKLIGMYISFIPVFRMNKITVSGTPNNIKIQMDLKECVVTHISRDIILQDETLDTLSNDRVLTTRLAKQWAKLK